MSRRAGSSVNSLSWGSSRGHVINMHGHTFFLPKVWTACVAGAILLKVGSGEAKGEDGIQFKVPARSAKSSAEKGHPKSSKVARCNPAVIPSPLAIPLPCVKQIDM